MCGAFFGSVAHCIFAIDALSADWQWNDDIHRAHFFESNLTVCCEMSYLLCVFLSYLVLRCVLLSNLERNNHRYVSILEVDRQYSFD